MRKEFGITLFEDRGRLKAFMWKQEKDGYKVGVLKTLKKLNPMLHEV